MTWIDILDFLLYPPWWFCIGFFAVAFGYYYLRAKLGLFNDKPNFWDYM